MYISNIQMVLSCLNMRFICTALLLATSILMWDMYISKTQSTLTGAHILTCSLCIDTVYMGYVHIQDTKYSGHAHIY